MLILGVLLIVAGLAVSRGIERRFATMRDDNPFFDSLEESLFYPGQLLMIYVGHGMTGVGAILLLVALL